MRPSERSFARRIDLTSLQLFVAVCELGSIGRAAEREFIAASAVSKRLSDLEATVDTALLYRHSRGVTLTPAGESLLHHARNVLYGLERMQGELVPEQHALAHRDSVAFADVLEWDIVSRQVGSSIGLAMRAAAAQAGHALHQRIHVTSLDAMCRMIDNGLGVGLIPDRAFEL